jgi:hypothetical protein
MATRTVRKFSKLQDTTGVLVDAPAGAPLRISPVQADGRGDFYFITEAADNGDGTYNQVMSLGRNVLPGGGREVSGVPYIRIGLESNFLSPYGDPGPYGANAPVVKRVNEWHDPECGVVIGGHDVSFRPRSGYAAHDGSYSAETLTLSELNLDFPTFDGSGNLTTSRWVRFDGRPRPAGDPYAGKRTITCNTQGDVPVVMYGLDVLGVSQVNLGDGSSFINQFQAQIKLPTGGRVTKFVSNAAEWGDYLGDTTLGAGSHYYFGYGFSNDAIRYNFSIRTTVDQNTPSVSFLSLYSGQVGAASMVRSGATADIHQFQTTADNLTWTTRSRVNYAGRVIHYTPNSTIADADLNPGEACSYLNESANTLVTKVKYSNGTVKTTASPLT